MICQVVLFAFWIKGNFYRFLSFLVSFIHPISCGVNRNKLGSCKFHVGNFWIEHTINLKWQWVVVITRSLKFSLCIYFGGKKYGFVALPEIILVARDTKSIESTE